MIANPPTLPSAPNTRGQIFAGGIVFAFALSFIAGGIGLISGLDAFEACRNGLATFLIVGLMGWLAELLIGPSLQRVVEEREREAAEQAQTSIGGATVPATPLLTGGAPAATPLTVPPGQFGGRRSGRPVLVNIPASLAAAASGPGASAVAAGAPGAGMPGPGSPAVPGGKAGPSAAAGMKGRTLDVTLPEESAVGPGGLPATPGMADAGATGTAQPVQLPPGTWSAATAPAPAGAETTGPATYTTFDNEFEDLAPLLRGASPASRG